MKFRKCFVLREQEIDMSKLKKGDVFRMWNTTEIGMGNTEQWSLAKEDAKPCEPEGNNSVMCNPIVFVEQLAQNAIRFQG